MECRLLLAAVGLWIAFEKIVRQSAGVVVALAVGRAESAFVEAFKAHRAFMYGFFRQCKGLSVSEDVRTLACADLGEFAGNPAVEAAGFFQIKVERAALQYGLAHVSLVVDLAHRLGNGDEGRQRSRAGSSFFIMDSLFGLCEMCEKL